MAPIADPAPGTQPLGLDNAMPVAPVKGNKSLVLHEINRMSFEERPIKPVGEFEVQVNVRQVSRERGERAQRVVARALEHAHCSRAMPSDERAVAGLTRLVSLTRSRTDRHLRQRRALPQARPHRRLCRARAHG